MVKRHCDCCGKETDKEINIFLGQDTTFPDDGDRVDFDLCEKCGDAFRKLMKTEHLFKILKELK